MSDFYERLREFRDEYRENHPYTNYVRILPVLLQLINCAFTNELMPDTLPEEFIIKNIMLYQAEFENLLKQIGLDVEVEPLRSSFASGNSFQVTQK